MTFNSAIDYEPACPECGQAFEEVHYCHRCNVEQDFGTCYICDDLLTKEDAYNICFNHYCKQQGGVR
jgi:hypothetical protein